MPLNIVQNNIVNMKVDAIVNAANMALQRGGGVCGAIFAAAGVEQLQAACDRIGGCAVGEAVITNGFNLPAKYIIHTVGPVWRGGGEGEAVLLRKCYINSLTLAVQHDCESVAFPLISAGIFGYPKDQALQVAVAAIRDFLADHDIDIYLVIYDKEDFLPDTRLGAAVNSYLAENLAPDHSRDYNIVRNVPAAETEEAEERYQALTVGEVFGAPIPSQSKSQAEKRIGELELDETFSEKLLRLIDAKGMTDVETYKRANIDRKLFSKIRSNKEYNPSKPTAIAFAIALRLSLDEALDLLGKAGYTLSPSLRSDVIIRFFIDKGIYDIHQINLYLFEHDQALLGA